ncbi:CobQ/CobB/MinD/ParA nucleotide binding domain protein [Clostridium magnum DSM 2767]|uniref:CobQ/CobB/MinD/ParA nucleotide binding domain protein n=1 Tax=Clostridium magnum DSM 2767 TaxID=1121326 RepID=A0A162SKL1_9CLOT|nr:CobQ/CobB/MinD/ParA nucleotide binding domain protein [Clostridium magnum DSM 2767]SHH41150.1 CobQ/CobB/MinD/ParA nucleotide binding domain-containing protein [Clostridium magnum DSM 2767]
MNIAVLSGKGGTGKTTVSTNLALALKASYIDCDVEEPNGFLFLKPTIDKTEKFW